MRDIDLSNNCIKFEVIWPSDGDVRVFTHTHTERDRQTDTHTYRRYDDINIPSFQMGIMKKKINRKKEKEEEEIK